MLTKQHKSSGKKRNIDVRNSIVERSNLKLGHNLAYITQTTQRATQIYYSSKM